jgi:hypothetical protein
LLEYPTRIYLEGICRDISLSEQTNVRKRVKMLRRYVLSHSSQDVGRFAGLEAVRLLEGHGARFMLIRDPTSAYTDKTRLWKLKKNQFSVLKFVLLASKNSKTVGGFRRVGY